MESQNVHTRHLIPDRPVWFDPSSQSYCYFVLASVMIATFMAVLDATIVNIALSKLMSTFGVSVDRVEWVVTAYLLIFAVALPSSAWFADRFGYKRIFLLGLLLFTVGSFLCSLSGNFDLLIFFRVLQGAGAGVLMPVGMAIVTREFPPQKRGMALGFWTVAASASVSLGPTVGGYLIDHFSWHTIFDVNVPVGIFGMIASFVILRERKSEEGRFFDLVGFLSLSIFLTALILALANGNSAWNTGGWTSGFILACFAFSIVGLAVFLVAEFNVRHPLIELVLFKSLDFTLSNIALFIFGLGMFGSTFLLPIYLQNSLGYTPFQAGLVFLPVGIITGITAPFAGYYSDKHNAKIPVIIGLALFALSFYQYSYLSFLSEKEQIMLPLYIRGVAMGFVFSPLTKIAITEISNQKMAQASGLINVIRQIGGSFGVAIFGTILTRRTIFHSAMYSQQLDTNSEAFRNSIVKLQHFVMQTGGGSASGAMAKAKGLLYSFAQNQAFIQAVDDVFFMAAIIILISLVPIFFLRVNHQIDARKIAATD